MPQEANTRFRVTKSFDFHPAPNIVMSFIAGEERSGLTKAQIEYGTSLTALEPITPVAKEKPDVKA